MANHTWDDDDDEEDYDLFDDSDEEEDEDMTRHELLEAILRENGTNTPAPVPTTAPTTSVEQDLMDEAFFMEMLGDDAELLSARLRDYEATKKVQQEEEKKKAAKPKRATKVKTEEIVGKADKVTKTKYPEFDKLHQWMVDEVEALKEMADGLYPGNIDIQNNIKFSDSEKGAIEKDLASAGGRLRSLNKYSTGGQLIGGRKCFTMMLLFPELIITNSNKDTHKIKNLYIVIELNGMLKMLGGFRGIRSTKTYAEYITHYGHSHMSRADVPVHTSNFCLGETPFRSLVEELSAGSNTEYNRLRFEMFLVQLGDYLQWESLEGGPYVKMRDIRANASRSRFQAPNSTQLEAYYKSFLQRNPELQMSVEDNGYDLTLSISPDETFWDNITAVTAEVHRLPLNEVTGKTYEPAPDEAEFAPQVTQVNRDLLKKTTGLTFKGVPVSVQIEVSMDKKKEDKKKYVAHESIVEFISNKLQTKLNEHFRDEFSNVS